MVFSYYVSMAGTTAGGVNSLAAYQSTAISPTVTFGTPVIIPSLGGSNAIVDKELIAVDKTSGSASSGRIYVAWTEFIGNTSPIVFSRSTNQNPLTFAAPVALTTTTGLHQGVQPAVGPDGAVYVVWGRFDLSGGSPVTNTITTLN